MPAVLRVVAAELPIPPLVAISARDQILGFGFTISEGGVAGEPKPRRFEPCRPELLETPLSESFLSFSESL